jgi:hypothetical protein
MGQINIKLKNLVKAGQGLYKTQAEIKKEEEEKEKAATPVYTYPIKPR